MQKSKDMKHGAICHIGAYATIGFLKLRPLQIVFKNLFEALHSQNSLNMTNGRQEPQLEANMMHYYIIATLYACMSIVYFFVALRG